MACVHTAAGCQQLACMIAYLHYSYQQAVYNHLLVRCLLRHKPLHNVSLGTGSHSLHDIACMHMLASSSLIHAYTCLQCTTQHRQAGAGSERQGRAATAVDADCRHACLRCCAAGAQVQLVCHSASAGKMTSLLFLFIVSLSPLSLPFPLHSCFSFISFVTFRGYSLPCLSSSEERPS